MKKGVRVLAVMGLAMVLSGCVQSRQAHTESAAAFDEPQYDWGSISGEKLVIWGIYPEMERSYITKAFDRCPVPPQKRFPGFRRIRADK